nr:hypothetical protein [Tanacetum cinerariifolium]
MTFVHRKGLKESLAMLGLLSRMAKAVNTACYVQNKVLVNKSHNKTPYELFNDTSPAIGFLKPFGCHVMILNTLDNLGKFEEKGDEGTISTNVSGTKDATSQEAKKDPQDHCSTEVPEGSGNPNPTASTSNPPADQMETLTVETPIPSVSSPVPTASSTNSQEPSSDARLISKRVANQEETPSLDNILSLINWNKSKKVEEQSFIATIYQKTDPSLLQVCLFSCFLSQVEPKKIFDALQDPSWVEAMQEELL